MISLPGITPSVNPIVVQPPGLDRIEKTMDSHSAERLKADHHKETHDSRKEGRGDIDKPESSSFARAAKHMVKDALKDFRHELKDMFKELGFDSDMIGKMAKSLIQPIKEALKSGADFTANLMVAAVSQVTAPGFSQFKMVAGSIDIEVNHSTGTVEIDASNFSIESQMTTGYGAPGTHLLDVADSDAGSLPDILGKFSELLDLSGIFDEMDDGPDEPTKTPVNLGSMLPPASTSGVDAPTKAGIQPPADEEPATKTEPTEPTDPAAILPEITSRTYSQTRITILAFEQFQNDNEERLSRIRLEAVIPLVLRNDHDDDDVEGTDDHAAFNELQSVAKEA